MNSSIKLCVFCGKSPAVKTKEHVVPQWLMKMTGDPKRAVNFSSFGPNGTNERTFSFDAFHFPACDACNNEWSNLEGDAKNVVEKLLSKAAIDPTEWNTLLDWLDKVRVGIWLGMNYLDRNPLGIEPKFHISQRVGTKDRSLIVARAARGLRLTFQGLNTFAFRYMPSCFGVTINDIVLLNISYEFLVSKALGFPYPIDLESDSDGNHHFQVAKGTEEISTPPLDMHVTACATAIHQVVFKNWKESGASELWNHSYVVERSLDHSLGTSYPFLELESGEVSIMEGAGSRNWIPKYVFRNNTLAGQYIAGFCLDAQSSLWRAWASSVKDIEQRKSAMKLDSLIQGNLRDFRKIIGNMT